MTSSPRLPLRAFVLVFRRPFGFVPLRLLELLGLTNNTPASGDLRRVVRNADFVVKELAPDVADALQELARLVQELTPSVELMDSHGQIPQKLLEFARPAVVVRLFLVGHACCLSSGLRLKPVAAKIG